LIIEVKYIGIILSPNLMDLIVFEYLYGWFYSWPINTEFLGDDRTIFRVGVFRSTAFHCAYVPCRAVVHNNGEHMSYMCIDSSKFGKDDKDMKMLVKNGSRSSASSISDDRTNGIITITWQWLWRFRLVTIESLFLLAMVLSVLRFMDSYYPFRILLPWKALAFSFGICYSLHHGN
jgi:hypothetical protein